VTGGKRRALGEQKGGDSISAFELLGGGNEEMAQRREEMGRKSNAKSSVKREIREETRIHQE